MLILNGYHAFDRELLESLIDLFLAVFTIKKYTITGTLIIVILSRPHFALLTKNTRTHFEQVQGKKETRKGIAVYIIYIDLSRALCKSLGLSEI